MTDPVILLGTQSNGETLPVQVNSFGQLVAEGLQGPEGPQGDKGDTGETGPPGPQGEGVPTPYGSEGDVLTIKNSVPSWEPIPAPTPVINWADQLTSDSGWYQDDPASPYGAFDGDPNTAAIGGAYNSWLNLVIPYEFECQLFEVQFGQGVSQFYDFEMGGITGQIQGTGNEQDWIIVTRLFGNVFPADSVFKIKYSKSWAMLRGVRINGEQLLDPRAAALSACIPGYGLSLKRVLSELSLTSDIDPS